MLASPRNLLIALCLSISFVGTASAAEPLVSADWLAKQLRNPHMVVLDLRPAGAYMNGHIPGAVSEAENLSLLFPAVGCNLLIRHLKSPHPGG